MQLEVFEIIIKTLKAQSHRNVELYKLGVDLVDHDSAHSDVISLLLKVYYGEEGEEWIMWYVYERDGIGGTIHKAWDKNGKEICYDIPSLWKHVEEGRCDTKFTEFTIPKSDRSDDRGNDWILKNIFNING